MRAINVYTSGIDARVDFACRFVLSGRATTREFDACLEMGDGDEVAARIYRRALADSELMDAAPRYFNMDSIRRAYEAEFGGGRKGQPSLDLR